MPTIQNILHIQGGGAKAAALLDFIADRRYGRGSIDFNRITPMPPWVYRQPTNQELLRQYGEENCSRGWCQQNWGTAQNALRPERWAKRYDGNSHDYRHYRMYNWCRWRNGHLRTDLKKQHN